MPTKLFGTPKKAAAEETKAPARTRTSKASAKVQTAVSRGGDPWLSDDARREAVNAGSNGAKPRWLPRRAHRWLGGSR
jgi:hypothetical protein